MTTLTFLLLSFSSSLQALHLAHIPLVVTRPLMPVFPFHLPINVYQLQESTGETLHEFRQIFSPLLDEMWPLSLNIIRCPGKGSFPSSSDCSHFWECLGEDQVSKLAILYTYNPINLFVARALLLWGIRFSDLVVFFFFFFCVQLCIHSCLGRLHALMAFGLSLPLDYVLLQMRSHSLSFFLKIEVCSGRLHWVWWGYQQLIRNWNLSSMYDCFWFSLSQKGPLYMAYNTFLP